MTRLNGIDTASFDAVVIGGGMAGAGVARDLALRGASVALFEKGDFASGTSSKSSKLIHGGLRYLELFDFKLVRESLREKKTLEPLCFSGDALKKPSQPSFQGRIALPPCSKNGERIKTRSLSICAGTTGTTCFAKASDCWNDWRRMIAFALISLRTICR